VGKNDDFPRMSAPGNLLGGETPRYSGFASLLGGSVPFIPISSTPDRPSSTTPSKIQEAGERFDKRLTRLREILPIKAGRVVPDDDDLIIGGATRLKLAVLFLDICKFSQMPNEDPDEQDNVLKLVNLFMAEMLQVVKTHGGEFEKNTGDGLMSYFHIGSEAESTKRAVDAAVTMHCYNDQVISPRLKANGLPEIKFRVGIETGLVTIANVGVHGGNHRSLVAIGTTSNIACKLMSLIRDGGIVMGGYTQALLTDGWKRETTLLGNLPGFVVKGTSTPYSAWELKYRVPDMSPMSSYLSGILGGI